MGTLGIAFAPVGDGDLGVHTWTSVALALPPPKQSSKAGIVAVISPRYEVFLGVISAWRSYRIGLFAMQPARTRVIDAQMVI